MVNTQINEIRQAHQDTAYYGVSEKDDIEPKDLEKCIIELKKSGLSVESIREDILPGLGFSLSTLPEAIINLLNKS
ncbi:hypothetical protein D3C86_1990200 [compost metagenome]